MGLDIGLIWIRRTGRPHGGQRRQDQACFAPLPAVAAPIHGFDDWRLGHDREHRSWVAWTAAAAAPAVRMSRSWPPPPSLCFRHFHVLASSSSLNSHRNLVRSRYYEWPLHRIGSALSRLPCRNASYISKNWPETGEGHSGQRIPVHRTHSFLRTGEGALDQVLPKRALASCTHDSLTAPANTSHFSIATL